MKYAGFTLSFFALMLWGFDMEQTLNHRGFSLEYFNSNGFFLIVLLSLWFFFFARTIKHDIDTWLDKMQAEAETIKRQ